MHFFGFDACLGRIGGGADPIVFALGITADSIGCWLRNVLALSEINATAAFSEGGSKVRPLSDKRGSFTVDEDIVCSWPNFPNLIFNILYNGSAAGGFGTIPFRMSKADTLGPYILALAFFRVKITVLD